MTLEVKYQYITLSPYVCMWPIMEVRCSVGGTNIKFH